MSKGEFACSEVLLKLNIPFEYEYPVRGITSKYKSLSFDFKITLRGQPAYIEYDGQAHFYPVQFGGISLERAQQNFIRQRLNDKKKDDWCLSNNYKLLRIPYWRFKEIPLLIRDFISRMPPPRAHATYYSARF